MVFERRTRERLRQRLGPRGDPEPREERALRAEAGLRGGGGGAGQRLEIHMRGEIGLAGGGKRIGGRVARHRLKRVAQRAPVAVIHDQRRAALGRDARADIGGDGLPGAQVSTISPSRVSPRRWSSSGRAPSGPRPSARPASPEPHHPLAPAGARPLKLPDRQRVEKLVGDDEERALGEGLDAVVPGDVVAPDGGCLHRAQGGRGLDKVGAQRIVKAGHAARGAQQIGHERAATGAKLCQHDGRGRALIEPALREARPTSSPNIWLISGAVTKSPALPNGSRVA